MKKLLLIVTVLILSLSVLLSACDDGEIKGKDSGKESKSSATDLTSSTTIANSTDDSGSTHIHTYGEWITVEEATCEKEGSKVRTCSCGNKETEKLAKVNHNYVGNSCTMCKQKQPNLFVPDYGAGEANVVGSHDAALYYTAQAGYIYYSNANEIQKLKKNGSNIESVYKVSAGNVFNVNVVGDWIYFYCRGSTTGKSYIAKVRTDGSGFEKLVSSINVIEMLVVKNTVYYTTITENYKDYGKDLCPLYSVSVNGGTTKQIHDGAVSDLNADATYLYFTHISEDDNITVCRIKHGSTNKSVLLKNTEILGLSLENSKLYFLVMDKYDPYTMTIASISANGGSYTTYGKVNCADAFFHVIGNKAYFIGSAPETEANPMPTIGFVEYNMSTKTFKMISEGHDYNGFTGVFDSLIRESYRNEKLDYIEIYYPSTGASKKVKVS